MRLWIAASLVFVLAKVGWTENASPIRSLKGLKGVGVLIENFDEDAKKSGLSVSQLQADVELRLRKVGIKVLSAPEYIAVAGAPYLYVRVTVITPGSGSPFYGLFACSYVVMLRQSVFLERDPSVQCNGVTTWEKGGIGMYGENRVVEELRKSVGDMTDMFLNDYLTANPVER